VKDKIPANLTNDSFLLWLILRIADEFHEKAIIKGGIALRLLSCPRATNDLDYVFVPYKSRKEITPGLEKILADIPGGKISRSLNSKSLRIEIEATPLKLQIEASVSMECKSIPITTESLAGGQNSMNRIVRIMELNTALSHKLAAWNERKLLRDLYDVYFLVEIAGALPDLSVMESRLAKIEARVPAMRKVKSMTMNEFVDSMKSEIESLTMDKITTQLESVLDPRNLAGLDVKIRIAINKVIPFLFHPIK
jgi:predicted nucleotidyltransferase component of viral defense system